MCQLDTHTHTHTNVIRCGSKNEHQEDMCLQDIHAENLLSIRVIIYFHQSKFGRPLYTTNSLPKLKCKVTCPTKVKEC